jgi:hypothetical protein
MAAVSQPGSRAGLITALVIFVVLFLVSSVLYLTSNSALNVEMNKNRDYVAKYPTFVSESELTAPDKEASEAQKSQGPFKDRTQYDILKSQRDELARLITGQPGTTFDAAMKAATGAANSANAALKSANITVPAQPVTTAIATLTQAIVDRENQKADLNAKLAELNGQMDKLKADTEAQIKQFKDAIAAADTKAATAGTSQEQYRTDKDKTVAQLEQSMQQQVESSKKVADDLNQQIASLQQQITKKNKDLDSAVQALAKWRTKDVAAAMIRRVDGHIMQVNNNNVVYVDLGLGNQVTPGMTFQIYDKGEGIPRTGGTEDELPPGKGALEIVRVGPGTSECRILKTAAGESIRDGDLIANAVYDRNTKFRFFVYGSFDIDRDGRATAAEAEQIKRLIIQFGGVVVDKIDVDTDFVVMGKEPVVPDVKPDDQVSKFEHDKAMEELKKYEDIRDKATTLFIPVMNQNRFLYQIGYYDQAPRQVP